MIHLLRLVALVDEPRQHVPVVDGEVVALTVDVGRDHGREVASVLLLPYGQSTKKIKSWHNEVQIKSKMTCRPHFHDSQVHRKSNGNGDMSFPCRRYGWREVIHKAPDELMPTIAEEMPCTVDCTKYLVATVEDVDHTLGVRVTLVAGVGRAVVDHHLIDGVGSLVREDTGRQARYKLFHLVDPAALHDVVVDENVLTEELYLVLEVAEQPADLMDEI